MKLIKMFILYLVTILLCTLITGCVADITNNNDDDLRNNITPDGTNISGSEEVNNNEDTENLLIDEYGNYIGDISHLIPEQGEYEFGDNAFLVFSGEVRENEMNYLLYADFFQWYIENPQEYFGEDYNHAGTNNPKGKDETTKSPGELIESVQGKIFLSQVAKEGEFIEYCKNVLYADDIAVFRLAAKINGVQFPWTVLQVFLFYPEVADDDIIQIAVLTELHNRDFERIQQDCDGFFKEEGFFAFRSVREWGDDWAGMLGYKVWEPSENS